MAANTIVLRASPDWRRFDPESSRAFCVHNHLPETTVIDFVRLWDAELATPYRAFRHALKTLALQTFARVREARLVTLERPPRAHEARPIGSAQRSDASGANAYADAHPGVGIVGKL